VSGARQASTGRGRQQRGRETEQLLLEAAVTALVEHGYAGASTVRIQQIAGVSRGRLLHHFPSRERLLVAAVRHLAERRLLEHPTELPPDLDPAARVDATVAAMWATYHSGVFWASAELWLAARHSPELRRSLLPSERELGATLAASCARLFGDLADHPAYPGLYELLNTSMRGTAMTYAFNERDPAHEPALATWQRIARETLLEA